MENESENLISLNKENVMFDFEKELIKNQQLCLIYISSAHIKKEKGGEFSIVIEWKDHFKSNFIKYNEVDFINDIWIFLNRKEVDISFKKKQKHISYKIITLNNEKETFNYYFKYLNFAFDLINENLIYKSNFKIFIEEFLFAFFILRGSYDDSTFEYSVGIFKNSYLDKKIPCNFFFEFYSKKIAEILEKYNFPKVLKFIYVKKSNVIQFRVKAKFLSVNINSFKNNKLSLNFPSKKGKDEFPNNINDYIEVALQRRNKYNNIFDSEKKIKSSLIENIIKKNKNDEKKIKSEINISEEIYFKMRDLEKQEELIKIKKRDIKAIKEMKELFYYENKRSGFSIDKCDRCGYSFYEEMKKNDSEYLFHYIEVHHKIPFSKMPRKGKYKNLDEVRNHFSFLCSNCHVIEDKKINDKKSEI